MRNGGARRVSSFMTHGYRTRRLAIDYSIPLVTDVKCTKLLVEALRLIGKAPLMKTHTDCMSSRRLIKLPGFIDTHVHVREPGATHKEDYSSCTAAALAGGVTMICAMPNTNPAVTNEESLNVVKNLAQQGARCDYAIYMGASSDNYSSIPDLAPEVAGLKMYLNETFTTLKLNDLNVWNKHLSKWPKNAPLCVHAEGQTTAAIILLASLQNRPVHICHVARKEEILIIKAAKEKGLNITCEVCPHHLFLTTEDIKTLGSGKSQVRPVLMTSEDQKALWENLHIIDCFATDHAPHTLKEKTSSNPPPGFPGLETILPLLLNAVNQHKLTIEDIIDKFYRNPKKIFNLPDQPNTYVEVDLDEEYIIPNSPPYSKAQWTPFAGMKIKGAIHRVVLRGEVAYVDGQILVQPGFGQNVRKWEPKKTVEICPIPTFTKIEYNDGQTNEIFKKLLYSPSKGHNELMVDNRLSLVTSPTPPIVGGRVRHDSTSAVDGVHSIITHHSHNLFGKHILSVDMFTKEQLNDIFNLAQTFRVNVSKDRPLDHILKGKVMASVFYEVSTRTSCSFAAAMQRLGGGVIYMDETSSSVKKGETLEDSVAIMAGYADVVVLRHPTPGSVLVSFIMVPLIYFISFFNRKPLIIAGNLL